MPKKKTDEVTKELTSKVNWGPVAAIVFVIVVYIVSQIGAAFILTIYPALRGWSAAHTDQWINNSVIAQFWATVLIEGLILLFVWLFLKHRKSNLQSIGIKGRPKIIDLVYVLTGYAVYFVTFIVVLEIVRGLVPGLNLNQKQILGFNQTTSGPLLWLVFVSLVLLPPIVEEILFRGFLYTGLKTKLPKITAALVTSAIFASLHLFETTNGLLWVAAIDTFVLSLVLIYLRDKTDKLWASMGLHMLKNGIAFAALFVFHFS